jgi:hypothetical protein
VTGDGGFLGGWHDADFDAAVRRADAGGVGVVGGFVQLQAEPGQAGADGVAARFSPTLKPAMAPMPGFVD